MATDPVQESAVPDAPTADPDPSGWDPGSVWRDRVQAPRLAREADLSALARPSAAQSTVQLAGQPAEPTARASAGWDPLETWRFRVLRISPIGKA